MARRDKFSKEYRALIDSLIRQRKAAGLTQVEVARALGIDQSQLSKFERRERKIDVVDYVRLCHALGLDPAALLTTIFPPTHRSGGRHK